MGREVWLAFIPVFAAMDPLGILPIYVSLTSGLGRRQRRRVMIQSLVTALCLAVVFIFLGKAVFRLVGISVSDFMIAGGAILFCIAVMDLLVPGKRRRVPEDGMGAVPIGTPLVVGPAVLTTSLILIDQYGILVTCLAVVMNLGVVAVVFYFSDRLMRVLGRPGTQAVSKIMALFLAAIGVMMIRKGIFALIGR